MSAKIKLNAASGGGSVSLEAPTSTTGNANVEFKLPVADGTSGQALTTNASGQLVFASISAGGASNISFDAGYGIDFSATSDLGGKTSELLDDYEEGTYTPVLTGTGGNPTQSYVKQNGYYIKIGRFVNVSVDLEMAASGVSSGNGSVLLSIPFVQANLTNHQGISASVGYAPSWGAITPTAAYAGPNSTTLYLLGNDKDTGANFVQANQVGNSTRLVIGFSYATT